MSYLKTVRSCRWFNNKKCGFTLIEMLVSLVISGLVLWTLFECVKSFHWTIDRHETNRFPEWQQFLLLMEREFETVNILKVNHNVISVLDKESRNGQDIKLSNGRIYKTPGFVPYLYGVEDFQVMYDPPILWMVAQLEDGQTYEGRILIEEDQVN